MAWALEYQPTILLPGKGFIPYEPWPFQQEFLCAFDQYRAVNKPRQCGISTTAAVEAAFEFDNIPGSQTVIISKDQDAATNFHKYVTNVLISVRKNNPDAPKLLKENERETTNALGNRIVSLASSKEAGRSFSATHLFLDELAFQQYAEEIFQAAAATLAQTNGRITGISTPKGRANLFARIFETPGNMGFRTFSYGWWDVPTYNPFYAQYSAAETREEKLAWIDKARQGKWYKSQRPKYTDLAWRQEFEGAFDANVGSVFSTRALDKTFERNYLQERADPAGYVDIWYTSPREDGHLYACGIDLGRKNDPTVIITYDYTVRPARVVDFKYVEAGRLDWHMIRRTVREHLEHWRPAARHDATGIGDNVTEEISGYSEPFTFTKEKKTNIITSVQLAMDNRLIRMPKIDVLYREHQRYQWDDKDIVQDTVMANALAVSLFYEPEDALTGYIALDLMETAR